MAMRAALAAILVLAWCGPAAAGHRLGIGAHYWTAVEDIDVADVDESGVSWLVSYQYDTGTLLKLEADLEIFAEDFGGAGDTTWAPQFLALVGSTIYGGLGVGWYYADGDFADDPFFLLRAGLDFEILPLIWLDVNANYHFSDFSGLGDVADDIDTDTVTLGAFVRMGF
jgi:hypothetical protein